MPLCNPVSRKLAHTRVVTCHGYRRDDDLWDIEGRIVDTKPPNYRQRKQGEDLPPRLLGYFPYKPMGLRANVTELEKELEAREISFDC